MAERKEKKTGHTTPENGAKRAKKPPKYTGWKRVAYYAYIALTVLSAIIVVGYIAWNLFAAPPDPSRINIDPDDPSSNYTRPPQVTTIVTTDPDTGEEIQVEIEIPGLSADRKSGFYTFLLVGQDQGGAGAGGDGGQTDTMILVAYDVAGQRLSLMSLPRDTWVSYRGRTVMLNSVYSRYGAGENGMRNLKQAVGQLTGVVPDYTIMVQWEAIGELVDAIGGVYFEVPFDMYYYEVNQHFEIDLKAGYQLLNGSQAMQLIRWRQNSIGKTGIIDKSYGYREGDLGRIKTQQAFLKEVIRKCLQPDVLIPKLGSYIQIFQDNVVTDLSAGNVAYFVQTAVGGLAMDEVTFVTLPTTTDGGEHLLPIGSQIVRTVNQYFNPYQADIHLYELTLADRSPLLSESPAPEDSEDPEESPSESGDPDATDSPDPTDPVLPPGGLTSSDPSESPEDSESPEVSPTPGESGQPSPAVSVSPPVSESPSVPESPSADPSPSESEDRGEESPPPPATAEPTPTPPAEPSVAPGGDDEIPDLPPGYNG